MPKLHRGNITRESLLKHLAEGICKLTFVKKDGTVRNAYSTLNPSFIPIKFEDTITKIYSANPETEIMPFWDIVENKWKSFYISKAELLITADELSQQRDLPENVTQKDPGELKQIQIEKQQSIIEASKEKANKSIDIQKQEKTVDPVNRQNVSSVNRPNQTRSNVTKLMEEQKTRLDNARNIINKLRKEAEEKRRK